MFYAIENKKGKTMLFLDCQYITNLFSKKSLAVISGLLTTSLFQLGSPSIILAAPSSEIAVNQIIFETEPDARILAIKPYSQRALGFAQVYAELSKQVNQYLGEPQVITTLAFESHVVKDVSENLELLEKTIQVAKALRATRDFQFSEIFPFFSGTFEILTKPGTFGGFYAYAVAPFFQNAPWNWGWRHLDASIKELESLHENMSAMNMHIFRYMTNPGTSALTKYFKAAQDKGKDFDGWVYFVDDQQDILREAFHRFYLIKNSKNLKERKQLSWEFSILMIAFEQIQAQKYYDAISSPHEKLAGSFFVEDPIGHYNLAKASWADFRVRFSLPLDRPLDMLQIDSKTILANSVRPGTIPHYYWSRIQSDKALLMLAPPAKVKNFRAPYLDEVQSPSQGLAQRILNAQGCLGCHTHSGAGGTGVVGPDLTHIGSRLDANEIQQSIFAPNAVISNHCPTSNGSCPIDVMPNYSQKMSMDDLQVIANFLRDSK